MLDRPSSAVKKSVVMRVGALLAMMAVLVLSNPAPNGVFAHPHDLGQTHMGVAADTDDHIHIHYAENGTGEVRDFDSTDPEGSEIKWEVRGVDAADFDIDRSTGVLTFMVSPDYENPTDRGLNLNPDEADTGAANEFIDPGEFAPNDRNYQITVSATEMRAGADAPLPAKRTDMALTVVVGNEDDPGDLTLEWLQPEVDVEIDANLTDPDGETSAHTWTWYTSNAAIPVVGNLLHWTQRTTGATFTPLAAYKGDYLWVHVEYLDPQGGSKEADAKSENPVRAAVSSSANASPDFPDDTDTRTVPESTAVGDPVGDTVTATDSNKDTLTYELMAAAVPNDDDDEFFDINMATGQITVAQALDYDEVGERTTTATAGEYKVIVRATDPSGLFDNITITITAENVNEDPIVTGRAELSVEEGITDADDNLVYTALPDAPDENAPADPTKQRNEYVYQDPDEFDSIALWTLEGDDAEAFDQSGRFEPRYLQFKVAPDYENPTDANSDNVYEVTLVATDTDPLGTGAGIGRVKVWLIVTNVEEKGKVVFTEGETAYLNEMLVAEVQDPDDKGGDLGEPHKGVHIVTWQWSRAFTDAEDAIFDPIPGATTNRYTPEDDDTGYYLRATATYTDPHSAPDDAGTDTMDERIAVGSLKTEMATTEYVVDFAPGPESVPAFDDETGAVTREVAENTAPGGNVGAPVTAKGPETLVYSLEGSDARYFNINSETAQITVGGDDPETGDTEPGTDPEFDFDDPMKKQRFNVTVKVKVMDGDATQNAEVDVNIVVTDVDELPEITDADGEVVVPPVAVDYPEIDEDGAPNTAAVATYVGTDAEGDTISWDLRGADAALFTIPGGVLQFVNPPDYEDPKDRSGDNTATPLAEGTPDETSDNMYSVVIRAIASRASGDTGPTEAVDTLVNVTVTDVDEDGEVVISWLQPEVGTAIMASLTDPDGDVPSPTWEWTVSEVEKPPLDVNNPDHWGAAPGEDNSGNVSQSYTPAGADLTNNPGDTTDDDPIDEGKFLRVTATYSENGQERTAHAMSAYPVQARGLGAKNQSPDFDGAKVELSVAETAEVGDDVPGAVVATVVAPSSTDILTYRLRAFAADDAGTTGVATPADAEADLAAFDIKKATGQITVAQKLDFESRGPVGEDRDGEYVVVVEVFDPSADATADPTIGYDFIVVVITAEDINEDPVLSGRPELTIPEIDSSDEDAANPDFDDPDSDGDVNVYNVVDEDRRAATNRWSLEGEDKGQFQLIGNVGRTLVFRNQPDYETPADADGDNVYKVTVVTLDGHGGRGEFDVCIAVMNVNEAGKITLRDKEGDELTQPYAHGAITADLTDPDGGVTGVTWVWSRAQVDPPGTGGDARNPIADTDSKTYTPTNDDTSYFLHVMATYMDAKNDATTDPPDTTARTAVVTAMHAVLEVKDEQRPPAFPEATATRVVAENAPSTTFVGEPLALAMDPDDPQGEGLTYTLEDSDNDGEDTAFFELHPSGPGNDDTLGTEDDILSTQIRVRLHDEAHDLDHEAEGRNGVYEVVLKVTDGSGLEDTITVSITVTDRNEAPSTPVEASDDAPTPDANNAPVFPSTETGMRSVAENTATDMPIGDPVAATDADAGDTLSYTLGGTDMASFAIDDTTGQLMTMAALDYEAPADADTDNAYEVTVTASDGNTAADATIAVTIMVTDMGLADSYDANEDGMIGSTEVLNAVEDYFNDVSGIDSERILDIVELYFSS